MMRPRTRNLILLALAAVVAWMTFLNVEIGLVLGVAITASRFGLPAADATVRSRVGSLGREPSDEEIQRARIAAIIINTSVVCLVAWVVSLIF